MFDRVIVSSDDSHFKDFWPIVCKAWKKYFPEVKVCLAFVTNRNDDDETVQKMKSYGEVYLFKPHESVPTANQAKMCRFILAGQFENDVCMIEDIDTIPLQKDFINRILNKRKEGHLLCVGSEVYLKTSDEGKFPVSNLTGESYLFKVLINPKNLNQQELIESWIGIYQFDNKESISNSIFSDESLLRVLISRCELKNISYVDRNVNIQEYWIDRSWWRINEAKLSADMYVICNFLRPIAKNYDSCKPIINHIFGSDVSKEIVLIDG